MKYIRKGGCPRAYSDWCKVVEGTSQADWRYVAASEKEPLLVALICEQGALCAYSMRRIGLETAHVEHIKPESLCRDEQPGSDLDYNNLVACFPRQGMAKNYRYGAQKKGNWWEHNGRDFVSPLHPRCENLFHFDLDGNITAVDENKQANVTIRVLCIDHPSLTEDRKRAIEEFIYGPNGDEPLSPTKAERALTTICLLNNGQYYEFCIAIRDAIKEYITLLRKRAQRRRAVGRAT